MRTGSSRRARPRPRSRRGRSTRASCGAGPASRPCAAGASVALVSQTREFEPPPGAALVRVDDVLRRLQDLARTARAARPELRVVGVGGSAGKTSTKDLLAAALVSLGCYANRDSYNN